MGPCFVSRLVRSGVSVVVLVLYVAIMFLITLLKSRSFNWENSSFSSFASRVLPSIGVSLERPLPPPNSEPRVDNSWKLFAKPLRAPKLRPPDCCGGGSRRVEVVPPRAAAMFCNANKFNWD